MRVHQVFAGVLAALLLSSALEAAVIVNYDLAGATTSAPENWGATETAEGISGMLLTRGSGVGAAGLTNGFSANNWDPGTAQDPPTRDAAMAAGEYFQWGFTVQPGYEASVSTFDTNMRRSAIAAPMHYALFASLDNFATQTLVAEYDYWGRSSGTAGSPTPYQWMTTDTPGQDAGNPISTMDLSSHSFLQNIPEGTTVTFRLTGWGEGAGALTNTVALGRFQGPLIQGDVSLIPEPTSLALMGVAAAGAFGRRRRQ